MCGQEGDEAVRGPSATLRDSSQVECGNHSWSMLVGNLSLSDCLGLEPSGGGTERPLGQSVGRCHPAAIARRSPEGSAARDAGVGISAVLGPLAAPTENPPPAGSSG